MNKVLYLYLLLILTCTMPHVVSAQATAVEGRQPDITIPASGTHTEKLDLEESANQKLQSQNIQALNYLINDQKQQILSMQEKIDKIEDDSGLNFAVWSGILLTSVAVILTALGIVMALFSFFGYKKMINSAKDAATISSNHQAMMSASCPYIPARYHTVLPSFSLSTQ